MTILGIGFFLKYAFDQNWVGPAGRVLLGYLAAGAFLAAGEWSRRHQAATFGLYLIGGGIATLYLSTFAAYQLYGLLGQVPAFGFMVLVTIFAGLLALFYDAKWLAVMGLVGGFLTPVILSTGQRSTDCPHGVHNDVERRHSGHCDAETVASAQHPRLCAHLAHVRRVVCPVLP